MNNMYDLLNKMTLLEGKGSKPDFLDLDKDGNKKEPMKKAAKEVKEGAKPDFLDLDKDGNKKEPMKKAAKEVDESTGDYSAKKARAGKDIGKPGKAFATIAAKAGKSYGSKERGEKVAGAVLKKLRAKESVGEEQLDELDMNLIKAMQKGHKAWAKDPESERNIHKKYGYRGDREEESDDDYDEWGNRKAGKKKVAKDKSDGPKKRGRPAGAGKKLGAKGPTGRSKLLKKEDVNEGEVSTGNLHQMWQLVTGLKSYVQDPDGQTLLKELMGLIKHYVNQSSEPVAEKAVSKAQQKFMGMVHAAQKGEKPASPEVAKVAKTMKKSDAEDFAATKHKGLPEKKKKETDESTVAGSIAPVAEETPKKSKGGIQFGKGVYESQISESFDKKLGQVLTEGMSINMSVGEDGTKSMTVNATDEDAVQLAQILKMAGLGGGAGGDEGCGCGSTPCSCEEMAEGQDDVANSPEPEIQGTSYMTKTIAGGLNKNKATGMTTIPVVPTQAVAEDIENQLLNLYKQYKA